MKIKYLIICVFAMLGWIVTTPALYGKTTQNQWFRLSIIQPINEQLVLEHELQHRRRANWSRFDWDGPALLSSYRSWWHMDRHESFKFSLSPFAYYSYLNKEEYTLKTLFENYELRFSAAFSYEKKIIKQLSLTQKNALEYRVFNQQHHQQSRFRNTVRIKYKIDAQLNLSLSQELILNLSDFQHWHYMDQQRFNFQISYQLFSGIDVDFGYLQIQKLQNFTNTERLEHNLYLNLVISPFIKC